jgi:hypothetical protein
LPKNYTSNQTGAIACGFAGAVWGLTAHAVARMFGLSHPVYTILVVLIWILLPFYIKLVRHAFIVGIFISAVSMCYLLFLTSILGTAAWFTFSRGLYDFTYVLWYLILIAGIYFAYKSWKELLKK